jgi:hypothetical protein
MAESLLGSYSPESMVIVISKGDFLHTINGYADGTFLNISRITPASELYVGSDLTAGRVKRRNKASTITLTLMQHATSNAVLQALQRADEEDDRDSWVFSITIKDLSGTGVWSSNQAFIATNPDTPFSNTTETRDWVLQAVSLNANIGANTLFAAPEVQAMNALGADVDTRWQIGA